MSETGADIILRDLVESSYAGQGLTPTDIRIRQFPDEVVVLVSVHPRDFERAIEIANAVDGAILREGITGFVAVRRAETHEDPTPSEPLKDGVRDERADEFVQLLSARSRTSEMQPSLSYVKDAAANISLVVAPRHQLIFGRRGAGKTALLLESRRLVEKQGAVTVWLNVQTYRWEPADRLYLWFISELAIALETASPQAPRSGTMIEDIRSLRRLAQSQLSHSPSLDSRGLIPRVQQLVRQFTMVTARRLFLYLDDFHYLARTEQPKLLDMLHASLRDTDAWLKIASIRHLTSWFDSNVSLGLETGHDADHIDLDVTLQDPARAKSFLEEVLERYAHHVAIPSIGSLFSKSALDRLVLAAGAVPRDYLVLASRAIVRTKMRPKSRLVGVEDVNNAAGDAAKTKIDELEDDLASDAEARDATLAVLNIVKRFCLDEKAYTYFRIDFKDKEELGAEYSLLTSLLDVRLIHLVDPGVSEAHKAGERSEVFMLDLSQFSGQRLKKFIRLLDFVGGHLVSKETGKSGAIRVGDTPRKLNTILRTSPQFELSQLSELTTASQ